MAGPERIIMEPQPPSSTSPPGSESQGENLAQNKPSAEPKVVVSPESLIPSKRGGIFSWRGISWLRREPKPQVLIEPPKAPELLSQGPDDKLPYYSPGYDPNKPYDTRDTRKAERAVSVIDPDTGREVARLPKISGAADRGGVLGWFETEESATPVFVPSEGERRLEGINLNEDEVDDKKYLARKVLRRMDVIDTMSAEERTDEIVAENADLSEQMTTYSDEDKVFQQSNAVTKVKEQTDDFDKKRVDQDPNRSQEEKEVLRKLLNALDTAEHQIAESEETLGLQKDKKNLHLFSEKGWQEQEQKRVAWQREKDSIEAELIIRTLTPEEGVALRDVVSEFNSTSNALVTLETILERQGKKGRSSLSQQEIEQMTRRREELLERKEQIEEQIRKNPSQFLKARRDVQKKVEAEVKVVEDEIKKREASKADEIFGHPSEAEKKLLEEILGEGEKVKDIRREDLPIDLPNFSEASKALQDQELYRRTGDARSNEDIYQLNKEIVGWYFQEAGRLGILFDLDEDLGADFEKYMGGLGLQPVVNQRGEPVQSITITLSDLRSDNQRFGIRVISQSRQTRAESKREDPDDPPGDWDDVYETGRFSEEQMQQLQGVRGEYVRRAYEQMRISLTNLVHHRERLKLQTSLIREKITEEEYERKLVRIPRDIMQVNRVYGEWNFGFESGARRAMEKWYLAEQNRPMFEEDYFRITLHGENSREIELAAEQAAEHITRSAGTYSIDAVRQRRELLIRAVDDRRNVLEAETGGVKEKTDELVDRIRRVALNKLDFFILQWLAHNLRMAEYSDYFEQTVMQEGIKRIKTVPSMSDGFVGLAVRYLLTDEYRLFFKPGGFRNQLNKSNPQDYLRELKKDQLMETLMAFELDDNGQGWEGKAAALQGLMLAKSTVEFQKHFTEKGIITIKDVFEKESYENIKYEQIIELTPAQRSELMKQLTPKQRLDLARTQKDEALKRAQESSTDPDALIKLREARDLLAFEQNRYQTARNRVKNAVEEAVRFMDVTGESAKLSAPSIIMGNGDSISVDEVTLFYKYAILQTDHEEEIEQNGKKMLVKDNQALIRWRSTMWRAALKEAALDKAKARPIYEAKVKKEYQDMGQEPPKFMLDLKEGFEDTGWTKKEWQSFEGAVRELRVKGERAEINGVKFEDIRKMPHLLPVLSNFLADYKASNTQLNDDYLRLQAFKGRLDTVKNLLLRLGIDKPVEGTDQDVLNEYTQLIEDSRQLHAEVIRQAYFEATHIYGPGFEKVEREYEVKENGKDAKKKFMVYPFSPDRIAYGWSGKPWGIGRAQYRKAFEYTNLRRTTPRAVDLVHAIPFSLNSLSEESSSDDILSMCWDLNRLEKDDNWSLMTFGMRTKDAWVIGEALEGVINFEKGKGWGFLEKPLVDANSLRERFKQFPGGIKAVVRRLLEPDSDTNTEYNAFREEIVDHFQNKTLGRFTPIVIGAEKQLSSDRQAIGSGAGYEENDKFALRFLEWLLSEKPPSKEHGAREEGGWEAFEEIRSIIELIVTPNSYGKGSSIWDEIWRKLNPSHNIRLPSQPPQPTYLPLAA